MKNKFSILDEVYHITPDSPLGIVIDWFYCASSNQFTYKVVFTHEDEVVCYEWELSKTKRF